MTEYTVQYNIKVFSEDAVEQINKLKTALTGLGAASKELKNFSKSFESFNKSFSALDKKLTNPFSSIAKDITKTQKALMGLNEKPIALDTSKITAQLTELQALANNLKATLSSLPVGHASTNASTTPVTTSSSQSSGKTTVAPIGGSNSSSISQSGGTHNPSSSTLPISNTASYQKIFRDYLNNLNAKGYIPNSKDFWQQQRSTQQSASPQYYGIQKSSSSSSSSASQPNGWFPPKGSSSVKGGNSSGGYPPTPPSSSASHPSGAIPPTPTPPNTPPRGQRAPVNYYQGKIPSFGFDNNMILNMMKSMGIMYGIQGVGALVKDIVEQATEYDNTMKTVESLLKSHYKGTDFSSEYGSMVSTVRNVGMETKYKVTEVADAAKFLAMAGLDVQAIKSAIRPVADVALVGDTELGETADVMTNIMTGYGIAPSQMRNAADVMTNTFTMTNTTLMEMAESLKYMGPIYGPSGVPFQEATAAVGILGNAGLKGSQAGTTLRTIMANIMNPTAKMSAAWSELGIELKGKRLVDIFQELSDKQVPVEKFFKLFNRTAAQGAIALAQQVDTWNNVIAENFMSDGIAAKLADEKKNTIQGLWAQLTSILTDDGVQAFEGLHSVIKGFLRDTISWLKTDEAKKAIKDLFDTLSEFAKILVKVTEGFYKVYNFIKPVLIPFMKLQLMIMPITKGLSMLSKVFMGFMSLKGVSSVIFGFTGALKGLNKTAMASSAVGKGLYAGPLGALGALSKKEMAFAAKGLDLSRPHASTRGIYLNPNLANYSNITPEQINGWNQGVSNVRDLENKNALRRWKWENRIYQGRLASIQLGKIGAGAGLGMLGMNQMTREDGNNWDRVSGVLYTASSLGFMSGNLWVAGIAGALGAASQIAGAYQRADEIVAKYQDYSEKHQILNGIITNSSDETERSLEVVYTKNSDINALIQQRTKLLKEVIGLEKSQADSIEGDGGYGQLFNDIFKSLTGNKAVETAESLIKGLNYGELSGEATPLGYNQFLTLPNGKKYQYKNANGPGRAAMAADAAAANVLAYQIAPALASETVNGLKKRLITGEKTEDIRQYYEGVYNAQNPANMSGLIHPDEYNHNSYELAHWTLEQQKKSAYAQEAKWDVFTKRLAPVWDSLEHFLTEKKDKEEGKIDSFQDSTLINVLRDVMFYGEQNGAIENMQLISQYGIGAMYRSFGFWDGTFHEFNGQTGAENAEGAWAMMDKIRESITTLGIESDPAAQALLYFTNALMAQADAFLGSGDL